MQRRFLVAVVVCSACGNDVAKPLPPPVFPADYVAQGYMEVRNCRPSLEHSPDNIRVLASMAPDAFTPYTTRTGTFPTGAIVLKEQYYAADTSCTGPIHQWTVMERLDTDSSPDTFDWHWQRVDNHLHTTMDNDQTCIACHNDCGGSGDRFFHTCTDP
jgi:hypothetical protein